MRGRIMPRGRASFRPRRDAPVNAGAAAGVHGRAPAADTPAAGESLYGSASIGVVSPTIDGAENMTVMGADVAYQVPRLLETASVCPTAGLGYSTYSGLSALSIPLGVGIGTTLPLDESGATTLSPYVTPGLVWSRITIDGLDGSESSTNAALNAGATVGFDRFLAGAFLGKTFQEGSEAIFGIRVGYAF